MVHPTDRVAQPGTLKVMEAGGGSDLSGRVPVTTSNTLSKHRSARLLPRLSDAGVDSTSHVTTPGNIYGHIEAEVGFSAELGLAR